MSTPPPATERYQIDLGAVGQCCADAEVGSATASATKKAFKRSIEPPIFINIPLKAR